MRKVLFDYNQQIIEIECNEKEKMKDICQRFADLKKLNLSNFYFKYPVKTVDLELPFKKVISSSDSKNKCFTVLVCINDKQSETKEGDTLAKSKQIICPNCAEVALCEISEKDFKIKLTCKNGHINDLKLEEFEKSQQIDQSKIICGLCKKNNKANTFENKFFRCLKCKKDICPLCQNSHIKNESPNYIIDYDQKYFYCEEHAEKYNSYCETCKVNICPKCEKYHNNAHQIISYGKILIDEKQLTSNINIYKQTQKFHIEILKGLISIFDKKIKNLEKLCELREDVINNYIKENTNRNYELLMNLKTFHPRLEKLYESSKKIKEFTTDFNINIERITDIFSENELLLPPFTIRPSFDENKCIDTKSLDYGEFAQICDYQKDNKN